jgi:hypothetical protein
MNDNALAWKTGAVSLTVLLTKSRVLACIVILLASGSTTLGLNVLQDDTIKAIGIWEHGNSVLLFANNVACKEGIYLRPQLLVSSDEGKSWAQNGPDLYGYELKYILDAGQEVLIAGQYYIEGPTNNPFLLVYRAGAEWQEFNIYDGAADLLALAQDELRPNRLLAWVEQIDMNREDDMYGPTLLYQSLDRGRTWKMVKKVKGVPQEAPHLHFFVDLPLESGRWRVSEHDQPRARVEHIDETGQWRVVTKLPLPIQETCPEEEADPAHTRSSHPGVCPIGPAIVQGGSLACAGNSLVLHTKHAQLDARAHEAP